MKKFLWFFVGILLIGMVPLDAMEEKPIVIKGDIILLPEHLAVLSQEEQEIFSLTKDDEYADKLGVAVQVSSAEREAKKGKKYLLETYATAILGESKDKLCEEAQCSRILNVLGNWHASIHPSMANTFSYRVPFNFITKKKLKVLAKGKLPRHLEIPSSDKRVLVKLYFAKDQYAWAGETSCLQIAKTLIKEYEQLTEEEYQERDRVNKQLEQDAQLAMALEQEERAWGQAQEQADEDTDDENVEQNNTALVIVWPRD